LLFYEQIESFISLLDNKDDAAATMKEIT